MQGIVQVINAIREQLGIQMDFSHVMFAFALLEARVMPTVLLTPFLGGEVVPSEVRLGLGLMLGMVLFPVMMDQVKSVPVTPILFMMMMLKESFMGLTLSFIVNMIFDAANSAGQLIDFMSGTNQAQLMVPSIQQNVTLFANLKLQLTTTLFLTLGGHHMVIGALGESLKLIPLDQYPHFHAGFWPFFELIIRVFGDMIRIALALCAPVLLATFMTDLALGMVNRVAPQVQVFFVSMQIKPAVSVLIMFSAINLIMGRMTTEFGVMFRWLYAAIHLLS